MPHIPRAFVFFYGAYEVGAFTGEDYPRAPGVYAYAPSEGDGHEEVQLARQAGATPRCHFDQGGVRTSFVVRSAPRYGRLELAEFETEPVPSP